VSSSRPGLALGLRDHLAADAVAQVRAQREPEQGRHDRHHLVDRPRVPGAEGGVGVARLDQRVADEAAQALGHLRRRVPDDASGLDDPLAGQAGVLERPRDARELDVLVGERTLAAAGVGRPIACRSSRAYGAGRRASRASALSEWRDWPPSATSTAREPSCPASLAARTPASSMPAASRRSRSRSSSSGARVTCGRGTGPRPRRRR
jgi:hypothetical protein